VVDNLETAADYRALIPDLQSLVNPTKILLTSRHSLHDYPASTICAWMNYRLLIAWLSCVIVPGSGVSRRGPDL